MTSRRFSRVMTALVALLTVVAARANAQPIERSVYVSVTDQSGAPVEGLGNADFIVREDNVAREVLRVVPAEQPMDVAVLVDTSQTARNDISYIRQALPAFVETMTKPNEAGRRNQVAIIGFGERPTILTEYTSDVAQLKKGVDRIWSLSSAGAYFVDAISEVVQGFKKRESERPVIVAIVAEGPELSYRIYDQVLTPLKNSRAPLYALMLGTPVQGVSDEALSRSIVLDRGTVETGGVREQLLSPMALTGRLKQLADQLTHQYVVTYARPQSLIPPERVTVAAAKPGLTARGAQAREPKSQQGKP